MTTAPIINVKTELPGELRASGLSRRQQQSGADLAGAGVQDGKPNHVVAPITNNHVFIGQLAVGGHRRLFEVDIKHVRFLIVAGPEQ